MEVLSSDGDVTDTSQIMGLMSHDDLNMVEASIKTSMLSDSQNMMDFVHEDDSLSDAFVSYATPSSPIQSSSAVTFSVTHLQSTSANNFSLPLLPSFSTSHPPPTHSLLGPSNSLHLQQPQSSSLVGLSMHSPQQPVTLAHHSPQTPESFLFPFTQNGASLVNSKGKDSPVTYSVAGTLGMGPPMPSAQDTRTVYSGVKCSSADEYSEVKSEKDDLFQDRLSLQPRDSLPNLFTDLSRTQLSPLSFSHPPTALPLLPEVTIQPMNGCQQLPMSYQNPVSPYLLGVSCHQDPLSSPVQQRIGPSEDMPSPQPHSTVPTYSGSLSTAIKSLEDGGNEAIINRFLEASQAAREELEHNIVDDGPTNFIVTGIVPNQRVKGKLSRRRSSPETSLGSLKIGPSEGGNSDSEDDLIIDTTAVNRGFECGECGLVCKTRGALRKHLASEHIPDEPEPAETIPKQYTCPLPLCQFVTLKRDEYDLHIADHIAEGWTPTGKKRNNKNPLQRHRYKKEVLQCPFCEYSCTVEKSFRAHYQLHATGGLLAMKFSCPICGKDRPSESDLKRHLEKHKVGSQYVCDICPFKSVQLKKLIQHRRMHTGEKPHLCPYCPYRAARRDNLRSHVRRMHKRQNMYGDTFTPRSVLLAEVKAGDIGPMNICNQQQQEAQQHQQMQNHPYQQQGPSGQMHSMPLNQLSPLPIERLKSSPSLDLNTPMGLAANPLMMPHQSPPLPHSSMH